MKVEVIKPSQIPEDWFNSVVGLDIETEDRYLDSKICMLSLFKPDEKVAYVIPIDVLQHGEPMMISDGEMAILKDFLSGVRAVGHNLQFDLSMIRYQWGVTVEPEFDTFLFARIMQFEKQNLKDLFLVVKPDMAHFVSKFDDVMGTKPPFSYEISNRRIVMYSALDAVMPFHIMQAYKAQIKAQKQIIDLEMDYLKTAIMMRSNGLRFDNDSFGELREEYTTRVAGMQDHLDELAGFHCRVTSNADLTRFLIHDLKLKSNVTTPKGAVSMNEESREQMMGSTTDTFKRECLSLVNDLKREQSVTSSIKKLPQFIIGDKLTFNIEQIGYDGTARVYSRDYSINQLPKELRRAVIPDEGRKLVMFDWASAELYIAAYWSGCEQILEWYRNGVDLHTEISRRLLGLDEVSKDDRAVSKVVTFATIYGSEGDSVARRLGITVDEARALVADYFDIFPEIKQFRAKIIAYAHKALRTRTMLGRIRKLPDINSDEQFVREKEERRAFNTAIQASCADFFKLAAIKARDFEGEGVRYLFGVFDSHLLEVPADFSIEDSLRIARSMSDFSELFEGFAFRFDIAEGENWLACQSQL